MRIQSYETLATSFKTTLPITLNPTSFTAPMRRSSRGRCRGCCEYRRILENIPRWDNGMNRTCSFARTSSTAFKEALKQIESSSECGGLPMLSFLILPMQRVTRLPLLLDVGLPSLLNLHRCTSSVNRSGMFSLIKRFPLPVSRHRRYARKQRTKPPSTLQPCGRCTP